MSNTLTGFHAVITGASDGLGFCMSRALLRAGATVALAARPGEKLRRAVDSLKSEGLPAVALPMDVRSEESVRSGAKWVKENWGHLDLLVNNAGLGMSRVNPKFMTAPMKFFEMDVDGFRDMVDTNLNGYFIVSKYFAPIMIEQGSGRIANVSTGFGTMTRAHMAPYGASRAGSEALSKIMEAELKEYGICVNVIMPGGAARTGLLGPEPVSDETKAAMLPPDVMDETILFLASKEAEGLTGARITATQLDSWLRENGYR